VFSKYSANGFNVTNFAAYIYDATYALVKGIVAYNELLNDGGPLPLHISGLALKEVMISQNLSFNGVSGRVAFSSGRPYMANYGRGDRTIGVRYAVVNFNSENGRALSCSHGCPYVLNLLVCM
jgi:ABC-type branched-subunit amino acid transport system substrate-binding protein